MHRRPLVTLLIGAVVVAGAGVALLHTPVTAPAESGWIAYAPLRTSTSAPSTAARIGWRWAGEALLALGAGTAGATGAVLVLRRRSR